MLDFISKYLKVMVPQHIPLALSGLFVGIAVSGGLLDFNVLLAFISAVFLIGGFNTFNGVTDFKIDLINKPFRPIPSGKIKKIEAIIYSILLYALGILIAYYLTTEYFIVYLIGVTISILYSLPLINLRKRFLINSLTVTILYALIFPLAGWALMPANPIPIYILTFLFIFGFGLSITKDFEDFIGDKTYAVETVPVRYGIKKSARISSILLLTSFVYLMFLVGLNMIKSEFVFSLLMLPPFIYLIRKIYRKPKSFYNSINERSTARRIFFMLMSLGISVEVLIGLIAF
ncbi:MAG: UbiA family prenyltransferase [Candidatus Aenigmatarchaeota archaeon]